MRSTSEQTRAVTRRRRRTRPFILFFYNFPGARNRPTGSIVFASSCQPAGRPQRSCRRAMYRVHASACARGSHLNQPSTASTLVRHVACRNLACTARACIDSGAKGILHPSRTKIQAPLGGRRRGSERFLFDSFLG